MLRHLGQIDGFRAAQLWRREDRGQIEFVAVTNFESIDAVRAFAGSDYERAVVEPDARRVLTRFDERCKHYELAVSSADVSQGMILAEGVGAISEAADQELETKGD